MITQNSSKQNFLYKHSLYSLSTVQQNPKMRIFIVKHPQKPRGESFMGSKSMLVAFFKQITDTCTELLIFPASLLK